MGASITKKRRLCPPRWYLDNVATVLLIALLSGCSYVWMLKAVRFEPLSPNLQNDKTKVEWDWDFGGQWHRTLVVQCDGLAVCVRGHVGGSPGNAQFAGVDIDIQNKTGARFSLKPGSASLRPNYKGGVQNAHEILTPAKVSQGAEQAGEGPAAELRRISLQFTGPLPMFKKAITEFTLVREDTGEEYSYRFHLRRD